jgi:hypothetical protein
VGGVKEKVLAAHHAGIRRVILPADNDGDLTELPAELLASMTIILASNVWQVLRHMFTRSVLRAPAAGRATSAAAPAVGGSAGVRPRAHAGVFSSGAPAAGPPVRRQAFAPQDSGGATPRTGVTVCRHACHVGAQAGSAAAAARVAAAPVSVVVQRPRL